MAGPGDSGEEHLDARDPIAFERRHQRTKELPLLVVERRVQKAGQQVLPRPVPQAPRERVRIPLRRCRIGQGARVLVDAERERGRLQRRDGNFPLGEHTD